MLPPNISSKTAALIDPVASATTNVPILIFVPSSEIFKSFKSTRLKDGFSSVIPAQWKTADLAETTSEPPVSIFRSKYEIVAPLASRLENEIP